MVVPLLLVIGLAGCGATSRTSSPATTRVLGAPIDYSKPGPYKVGIATLTVGDTTAEVLYPADTASTERARHQTSYSVGSALSPELRSLVGGLAPELVMSIPIDVYEGASIDAEGPFPVVLHSHDTGSHNLFGTRHAAQIASWGFVVASPDHRTRDLMAYARAESAPGGNPDVRDLEMTMWALDVANTEPGGAMYAGIDTSTVGVEGHGAGARAAYLFAAAQPEAKAWIGQAPLAPIDQDPADAYRTDDERLAREREALATAPALHIPAMIVAGDHDDVVPAASVDVLYDWLRPPKRQISVKDGGHSSFLDLCAPVRDAGGLERYAESLPAIAGVLAGLDDGCAPGDADPREAARLIDQVTIAQYRIAFGDDLTDASLSDDYLRRTFPAFAGQRSAQP